MRAYIASCLCSKPFGASVRITLIQSAISLGDPEVISGLFVPAGSHLPSPTQPLSCISSATERAAIHHTKAIIISSRGLGSSLARSIKNQARIAVGI